MLGKKNINSKDYHSSTDLFSKGKNQEHKYLVFYSDDHLLSKNMVYQSQMLQTRKVFLISNIPPEAYIFVAWLCFPGVRAWEIIPHSSSVQSQHLFPRLSSLRLTFSHFKILMHYSSKLEIKLNIKKKSLFKKLSLLSLLKLCHKDVTCSNPYSHVISTDEISHKSSIIFLLDNVWIS